LRANLAEKGYERVRKYFNKERLAADYLT
jgi:hypothetical protein